MLYKTQRDCLCLRDRAGWCEQWIRLYRLAGLSESYRRAIVFQRLIPRAIGLGFLRLIYGEHGIDKSRTARHQSHDDKACRACFYVRQTAGSNKRLCVSIYVSECEKEKKNRERTVCLLMHVVYKDMATQIPATNPIWCLTDFIIRKDVASKNQNKVSPQCICPRQKDINVQYKTGSSTNGAQ